VGLTLSLIAAVAANGCIGRGGGLPWHIPQDLRHFKRLTMGRLRGAPPHRNIKKSLRPARGVC